MLVGTTRRIALGNVDRPFAAAVELGQITIIDETAVASERQGSVVNGGRGEKKTNTKSATTTTSSTPNEYERIFFMSPFRAATPGLPAGHHPWNRHPFTRRGVE